MRWGLLVLFMAGTARARQDAPADGIDFFEKRIRPVLVEKCFKCHSAKSEKLKGDCCILLNSASNCWAQLFDAAVGPL